MKSLAHCSNSGGGNAVGTSLLTQAYPLTMLTALVHIIGALIALGYAQNYYFHLRTYLQPVCHDKHANKCRPPQEQRPPLSVSLPRESI